MGASRWQPPTYPLIPPPAIPPPSFYPHMYSDWASMMLLKIASVRCSCSWGKVSLALWGFTNFILHIIYLAPVMVDACFMVRAFARLSLHW